MAAVETPLYVKYDREEIMYEDEDVGALSGELPPARCLVYLHTGEDNTADSGG